MVEIVDVVDVALIRRENFVSMDQFLVARCRQPGEIRKRKGSAFARADACLLCDFVTAGPRGLATVAATARTLGPFTEDAVRSWLRGGGFRAFALVDYSCFHSATRFRVAPCVQHPTLGSSTERAIPILEVAPGRCEAEM